VIASSSTSSLSSTSSRPDPTLLLSVSGFHGFKGGRGVLSPSPASLPSAALLSSVYRQPPSSSASSSAALVNLQSLQLAAAAQLRQGLESGGSSAFASPLGLGGMSPLSPLDLDKYRQLVQAYASLQPPAGWPHPR
jgi:hypothetical protein